MPAVPPYLSAGPETQWDGNKPDSLPRILAQYPRGLVTRKSTPSSMGSQSTSLAEHDPR